MSSAQTDDEIAPRDQPIDWFCDLFARAQQTESFDAARAALATCDEQGNPSVRFVLARHASEGSFVFYTNYGSPKARHLDARPRAALAFHWASLGFQVRISGQVTRAAPEVSDAYFASRPRGSQLAAWASVQSAPIADRPALEARYEATRGRFADQGEVPRPGFWGGYLLAAERVEVWHGRDNRLHDRWLFTCEAGVWERQRLQP